MNFYALTYGLAASGDQSQIMQMLKSTGADVIQTSDGLCIKSEESLGALQSLLTEKGIDGVQLKAIDTAEALSNEQTPKDVKNFISV